MIYLYEMISQKLYNIENFAEIKERCRLLVRQFIDSFERLDKCRQSKLNYNIDRAKIIINERYSNLENLQLLEKISTKLIQLTKNICKKTLEEMNITNNNIEKIMNFSDSNTV